MKQSAQGISRRRIRKACEPCRQRKVKCDGAHPCALCSGYGYECEYTNRSSIADSEPPRQSPPQLFPRRADSQSLLYSHNRDPYHQVFKTAGNEHPRDGTPKPRLYVLSEDDRSVGNLNTSFTRVDSAMALPRSLGISLSMNEPPRLQPFAWNLGNRLEQVPPLRSSLFNLVTMRDIEVFSNVYFTTIHIIFGFLDQVKFERQAARYWASQEVDVGFEVVLCGVLALGSLYSPTRQSLHEAEIFEHGRLALDHTFAHSGSQLSVDQVAGWILRALYHRTTAKPHLSWVSSSMAMHIAESIGLHQEMSEMKTTHNPPRFVTPEEWVATSLNRFFAMHYGRTPVQLESIGCLYPKQTNGVDIIADFVSLVRLLPPQSSNVPSVADIPKLMETLAKLFKIRVEGLPLLLIRAEICLCVYRKVRFVGITLAPAYFDMLVSIIRVALEAAKTLGEKREPWWALVGVPFQALCVLLSINTSQSLSLIPETLETLHTITCIFNYHSSREALQTAQSLVKASEVNKRRELEYLQRCLNLNTTIPGSIGSPNDGSEQMPEFQSFEWPNNMDFGWSSFLDMCNPADGLSSVPQM
ncbi:hypothetical protein B7494_g5089 [Chlorociboria aeruginascens]|nr:hypothetical protein B7494_g5089 [Chlorociboria aeruginascens]